MSLESEMRFMTFEHGDEIILYVGKFGFDAIQVMTAEKKRYRIHPTDGDRVLAEIEKNNTTSKCFINQSRGTIRIEVE